MARNGATFANAQRKWAELSDRQRALLLAAAAAELSLKVAALIDIKRRPADRIRGPKALWWPVLFVQPVGSRPPERLSEDHTFQTQRRVDR